MSALPADALLRMLRDPNAETQEIALAAGVPREDAARASRMVLAIAKVKADEILALPPPLALALLRAAVAAPRADVVASATRHASKEVAKEAKRVVYLLRTQGVAVPEPERLPPAAAPPAREPPVPCFASAIDGQGERAIWISRVVPGKGIETAQAVVSDRKGIVELHLGMLGRKEHRALAKDIVARGGAMGVAEIPPQDARSLVAAARKLNTRPPPEGTDAWLARLGPAAPPPDPASRLPALPEADEQQAVASSARLHTLPLLRGWLGDEEALRALANRLDAIDVSELYVDERQRREAARQAIADAVQAELSTERRALWASRLFSVAEHLAHAGDAENARVAAATARAVRAGVDAALIPFARLLVEKAFSPAEEGVVESRDAGGLIVPPTR